MPSNEGMDADWERLLCTMVSYTQQVRPAIELQLKNWKQPISTTGRFSCERIFLHTAPAEVQVDFLPECCGKQHLTAAVLYASRLRPFKFRWHTNPSRTKFKVWITHRTVLLRFKGSVNCTSCSIASYPADHWTKESSSLCHPGDILFAPRKRPVGAQKTTIADFPNGSVYWYTVDKARGRRRTSPQYSSR